jgi:hypothetical protein
MTRIRRGVGLATAASQTQGRERETSMHRFGPPWRLAAAVVAAIAFVMLPAAAQANPQFYRTPLFGLATAPGNSLYVADAGQGIVDADTGRLVAALPGVNDVAPIGRSSMWAVTTNETDEMRASGAVYRIEGTTARQIANTLAFEDTVDPADDGTDEGSNPFDLARLTGGQMLVADAAGNSLLVVQQEKGIDWVASFPTQPLPCPEAICGPGVVVPAHAVPTSVVVGPDGAYYVGELTGFPFTPGKSRIWRIEPGTRHAACGTSRACSIIADDRTAIIDLQFGPDGRLYVAQLEDAGLLAFEEGAGVGGSIRACDVASGDCDLVASGIQMLTAIAFRGGSIWHTVWSLVPPEAPPPFSGDVVPLTP